MKKYTVLRFKKLKTARDISNAATHNHRIDYKRKNIREERTRYNKYSNQRHGNKEFLRLKIEQIAAKSDIKNGQPVKAIEAILSFSGEYWRAKSNEEKKKMLKPWLRDSIKWLEDEFGKENIVDWTLHLDERTPHIHCVFCPNIDKTLKDGSVVKRLNCKAVLHNTKDSPRLEDYHTSYSKAMKKYGLERGRRKTQARHKTIRDFTKDMSTLEKEQNSAYKKFNQMAKEIQNMSRLERAKGSFLDSFQMLINQFQQSYKQQKEIALKEAFEKEKLKQESEIYKQKYEAALEKVKALETRQNTKNRAMRRKLKKLGLTDLDFNDNETIEELSEVIKHKMKQMSKEVEQKEHNPETVEAIQEAEEITQASDPGLTSKQFRERLKEWNAELESPENEVQTNAERSSPERPKPK